MYTQKFSKAAIDFRINRKDADSEKGMECGDRTHRRDAESAKVILFSFAAETPANENHLKLRFIWFQVYMG